MPEGGTYWCAMLKGKPVAGLFELTSPDYDGVHESWMSYLAVDDVDKRVAKAIKAGAKLMKPIFDVPGVGRIAMLMEPGGAGVSDASADGQEDDQADQPAGDQADRDEQPDRAQRGFRRGRVDRAPTRIGPRQLHTA